LAISASWKVTFVTAIAQGVDTKLNAGVEPSSPFAIGQLDAVEQIAGHSVVLAAIV
jgi:hypothetical protein